MKHNDWNMKPGEFHLTVLGVLMRPDGKYLITRRRMDKEWAAGWWEVPGGGVRAGEDSLDAVIREIKEETGVDVTEAEGGYAFSYKRVNPEEKNNYFVDIYKFILDFDESDVKTQEEEVSGFCNRRYRRKSKDMRIRGYFFTMKVSDRFSRDKTGRLYE